MLQATLRRLQEARAAEIEGEEAAEAGFTLIELMVVLLIIAILLAIAIPTFLGVTNTAGDRAAQSNLTNALTEAKALYQVTQAYSNVSGGGGTYTYGAFAAQAPEFNWQAKGTNCEVLSSNCISVGVADVSTAGDAQGVVLAAWSSKTSTCWYALDLENTPAAITGDTSAIVTAAPNLNTAGSTGTLPTAGVWYGKAASPAVCDATNAFAPAVNAKWGNTYTAAGLVN